MMAWAGAAAAVCAHGGGGSAYPDWVREWNKHGYAAIAMDLEGHLPGGKHHGVQGNPPTGVGHANAGPARVDWFGDRDLPDKEQWFYQAVADVIRANSLLRSLPEINPKKIGLTGISWSATVVSTVAGQRLGAPSGAYSSAPTSSKPTTGRGSAFAGWTYWDFGLRPKSSTLPSGAALSMHGEPALRR
jgi:dienelactone hydrolase